MPTDIIMPQMGESIVEGTITKWLKKPGDKVQRDEPLFEISTDKVDAEIPAPASGILREIKVAEGTTVGVNTVVGTIAADGEAAAAAPAKAAPAAPEKKPSSFARRTAEGSCPHMNIFQNLRALVFVAVLLFVFFFFVGCGRGDSHAIFPVVLHGGGEFVHVGEE